ncbi:MAG: cyclase family protein [Deltaproteobacteria bacterium]|jgi:kynurenine formamidase|nr:cyclase family protein [Deltaproteobacteria bacterium]
MDPGKTRLHDLSLPIYHGAPAYPRLGTPSITRTSHRARDGFNAERLDFCSHTCTHVDMPEHFYDGAGDAASLPLERFWGFGAVLDLRGRAGERTSVGLETVSEFDKIIGPGDFVLINTGWNARRGYGADYMKNWPFIDGPAAGYLRDKGVKAVGIDTMSLGGYTKETAQPCHEILLSAGVLIIEEVNFPEEVMDGKKRLVSAFPLRLVSGTASPVRLVAYDVFAG